MAEQHKRREGYSKYYADARKTERNFVRGMMLFLVRMHPSLVKEKPREYAGAKRGPKPRHSQDKLSFLCMLKVAWNKSFEDVMALSKNSTDRFHTYRFDTIGSCHHVQRLQRITYCMLVLACV